MKTPRFARWKRSPWFLSAALLAAGLLLVAVSSVRADHVPFWFSVDGGGDTVSESGYTLTSAIGQHDAGALYGPGEYTLIGGVLAPGSGGAVSQDQKIFLPEVFR